MHHLSESWKRKVEEEEVDKVRKRRGNAKDIIYEQDKRIHLMAEKGLIYYT